MPTDVKMPQLSDTMDAGKILSWMKKEGETVKRGDILAEVETDKANLQIEAFQQGTLLKIVVPASERAKVGEVIAIIGQAGETVNSASPPTSSAKAPTPQVTPVPTPTLPKPQVAGPTPASANNGHNRVKASPLAKKLAEQQNIDLSQLRGSGPSGRIIKKDIETATVPSGEAPAVRESVVQSNPAPAESPVYSKPPPAPTPAPTSSSTTAQGTLSPLSRMRETIAKRMQESVRENPHFFVTISIDMRQAVKLRETLKELPNFKGISINHLVVKAAAYSLVKEPRVNRAMKEGQIYTPSQINIGIITAVEDGILIPVLKEADKLSMGDLVFEARAAVERARAGRPNSNDLTGGTFSVSNMGMFDVENFTAIINPGQGGILAVSSIKEEVIVEDHRPSVGLRMKATLSVDHRIIDGVMAGTWLNHFKMALEQPALIFI